MDPKLVTLPNRPAELTPNMDVLDFDLGGGHYARVIIELSQIKQEGATHLIVGGQAFQIDKKGNFVAAPLGYPSRTDSSARSMIASGINDTITLVDGWTRVLMDYDPELGDLEIVKGAPKDTPEYGTRVWDSKLEAVMEYRQGEAPRHAYQKAKELQQLIAASNIRSGLSFR